MKLFRDAPNGFIQENNLPKEVTRSHLAYLMSLGYLERFTLEPYREETPWKAAIGGIHISPTGQQEMLMFSKEQSDRRWQILQFLTATLLAIAALPETADFIKWLLQR